MKIHIYTDGSCLGNPGPGAWAFRIEGDLGELLHVAEGAYRLTTNNRMEMLAVIEAFGFLQNQNLEGEFHIYSDSSLVINTMTQNWKRKQNKDLWQKMDAIVQGKKVAWHWVRGHDGHAQNEDCDVRARKAAMQQASSMMVDQAFEAQEKALPPQMNLL